MVFMKFLAAFALIGSITWVIASPGFEPALAVVGSLSTLVAMFVRDKRKAQRTQQQSVSKSSVGVQAGGNVNIGDVGGDKHAK
jgi:hypothetical protein